MAWTRTLVGGGVTSSASGVGAFTATSNYLQGSAESLALLARGSVATPSTEDDAALIVEKISSSTQTTGVNAAIYGAAIKTTTTNLHRVTAVYAEGQDNAGGSGSFVEGVRAQGTLTAGTNGAGYGVVAVAGTSTSIPYKFLQASEAEVRNNSGTDAPATFDKNIYAAAYNASSQGTNIADAGFVTNPFNPAAAKFRVGLLVAEDSVSAAVVRSRAATIWGVDLTQGTQSTGAMGIPNNTPIRAKNAAGSTDLNILYVDANNRLVLGSDAAAVAIKVVATGSLPAAGAAQDGNIIIEDNGVGDRNVVIYAGGQRFRLDGGAAF